MRIVYLLESDDVIQSSDWVRYLILDDVANSYSMYSGIPSNNTQWLRVKDMFGPHLYGKTVTEFHESLSRCYHIPPDSMKFEFMRGKLPESHLWDKPLRNED